MNETRRQGNRETRRQGTHLRLLLLAFALGAGLLVSLGDSSALDSPAEPELLTALVDNALELAQADDPLQRAALCESLAKTLSREIQASNRTGDHPKTTELTHMLEYILVEGVAPTLFEARKAIPADSPQLVEFHKMTQRVAQSAQVVERALEVRALEAPGEWKDPMEKIQSAMKEVENQSQGKGPKHVPGWMKKGKKK